MSADPASDDPATWADALEGVVTALPEPRVIDRVAVVRETASTQDAARAMSAGRPGLLLVAGHQTAGRGRLGRAWTNTPAHALAMTLALDAERFDAGHVALAAGLGVCLAAESAGVEAIGLKWPNDVVHRPSARKLAGVLVERADALLLVGVGLNVSHADRDWPDHLRGRAVSLAQLAAPVTRRAAAAAVLRHAARTLAIEPHALAARWRERDVLVGAHATFRHAGRDHRGLVESIDPSSHIVLRTESGVRERLPAASTTLLRPNTAQEH